MTEVKWPKTSLRASHAKPWRDCTNEERLDPFNGLLMATQPDALFDHGFLTFDDKGRGIIGARLTHKMRDAMGLAEPVQIHGLASSHLPYLRYHCQQVAR